jgi:hypothetical protein
LRRLAALGIAVVLVSWEAGPAAGQSPITYPASLAPADVAAWLRRDTPISPDQVVDVAASAVTAIVSSESTKDPRGFIAILHAEALDPGIQNEEGVASWSIPVELDCVKRRVRLGPMTGFPGRDIRTSPKSIRDPDSDWVTPSSKAPLDAALKAMCDAPSFHRPLADVRLAALPAAPATSKLAAPAPPPAPPPVRTPSPPPARTPTPPAAAAPESRAAVPRAPASGAASAAVQIGASTSEANIRALLAKVQTKFAGDLRGLKTDVATVTIDQKTIYRGLIIGLHDAADAGRLCETLKAGGQACFIRR